MILYTPTTIITQFEEINFFIQSTEIEVQTHYDVKVLSKPNWQRGKMHEYCSSQQSGDIIFERVQKNIPDPELVTPSPKKENLELMFMPKQNKLEVLGVAEFVERAMIAAIRLGAVIEIK